MDQLLAIVPSILGLGLFAFVIRIIFNADKLERDAEAKYDAEQVRKARVAKRDEEPGTSTSTMER